MKLTTIRHEGATMAGRVDGDAVTPLPFADVGALLSSGPDWRDRAMSQSSGPTIAVGTADFAPLIVQPEKIVCVGANYQDHCEEVGVPVPEFPTLFAKYHRALIGAHDDLVLPACSDEVDWEVELGVVVGATLRHAGVDEALDAVAGYTIVNDISMRDWQLRTSQFLQGKTFEASTPVGPFLVTPEEVDHGRQLTLECRVDGEVMQKSDTSKLVFSVAEILAYVSDIITLVPGDIIATGTPAGVGGARKPPRYLVDGETVTATIDGLGEQRNRCVADGRR